MELVRFNPRLIYCSISGYGQDGPYRLGPGHDLNYLSMTGAMSLPGGVDRPPARWGVPVVDLCSVMFATVSILAALVARDHVEDGQYLDVSMTDTVFSWVSTRVGDYMVSGREASPEEMPHLSPTTTFLKPRTGSRLPWG